MSAQTKIEWCDATFNPWIGCTKVSPGCTNCYAEGESKRRGWAQWGKGKERHLTSASYWKQPLKWNREAQHQAVCTNCGSIQHDQIDRICATCLQACLVNHRPRVFCASLADVFDPEVPGEWRKALFDTITECKQLDWLLLTKRPDEVIRFYRDEIGLKDSTIIESFLPNVWLGVSVEDQKRADERIPLLLQIPAKIRFLSCEPLLGPVTLKRHYIGDRYSGKLQNDLDAIDWVICGGESGHNARPMHPDWARSLRDQCIWKVNTTTPTAFFFKQWGEWFPVGEDSVGKFKPISERDAMDRFHIWPDKEVSLRIGKKAAGRLLDGREWNEFPQSLSKSSQMEAIAR